MIKKIGLKPESIPITATIFLFFLIYMVGGFMYSGFFSRRVFINLFIDNAFLGIIAVGMTFVIISGGIDLSLGSIIAFTSVFVAKLIEVYHINLTLSI